MTKTNERKWENLGDINFVAYGGCLVKSHQTGEGSNVDEAFKYCFDVFYLNPEFGENGDENFAGLGTIDLTDNWLDFDGMLEVTGYDEYKGKSLEELLEIMSPELLAKEMVEYHGIQNFSPIVCKKDVVLQYPCDANDFIVTLEELNDWLHNIGADEHCVEIEED